MKISVFLAIGLGTVYRHQLYKEGKNPMFVDHLCLFKCFFQQLMKCVCFLQVVTLQEAKLLLKEDDDLIIAVYDYWLNKRLRLVSR